MKPRKQTERAVVEAAVKWWSGYRPCAWTLDEHLDNPTINCSTDTEHTLATAVGQLVRERRGVV